MAGRDASTPQQPRHPPQATTPVARRLAVQGALAAATRAGARRTRVWAVLTAVAVVVAIGGALIGIRLATNAGGMSGEPVSSPAEQVIRDIAQVPAAALDAVGAGTIMTMPRPISGGALTSGGKPRMLYVGAESCPFCAAERWAVAVALSRFGTFSGLGLTSSSPREVYPDTASLSFHGATYTSAYLSFTGVEQQSNQVVGGGYAPLDPLLPADRAIMNAADPHHSIPFVDIGGRYVVTGASYEPAVLAGKSQVQIAAALSDPASPVAKGVDGTANVITAALCASTGGKPAAVCSSTGVRAGAAELRQR